MGGRSLKIYLFTISLQLCIVAFTVDTTAQEPMRGAEVHYRRALSLYEAGKYGAARMELGKAQREQPMRGALSQEDMRYLGAMCEARLGEPDGLELLDAFLMDYPNSVYSNDIRFETGCVHYLAGDWAAARDAFLAVNPYELSTSRADEYYFKSGHALFELGDPDRAYAALRQVSTTGEYASNALYFTSYIDYERGNYTVAKRGFTALAGDAVYGKVVPFYLLHIEFLQGNYEYVTSHGDALMATATSPRDREIAHLMAESWFHLRDYSRVVGYMDKYRALGGEMGRQDFYNLGYSLYTQQNYRPAADALVGAAGVDDQLGQNASYHLAGCYLKLGDKPSAMKSFSLAAASTYDPAIAEDALFNCGKLQYELGGGVFNEAINLLTKYIALYPSSPKVSQARECLIAAYYNSKNYEAAYEAIKLYPNPDNNIKTAMQKIAYFRALEYYNAGDYDTAEKLLEQSAANRYNAKYTALASYWKGHIQFRKRNYRAAESLFKEYARLSPASEPENAMADYNIAYCAFNLKSWSAAQERFVRFLNRHKAGDGYRADTYNRMGDIYFAGRSYWKAIEEYDQAIKLSTPEKYYAQYQRAVMLGLVDRGQRKVETLQEIISKGEGGYVAEAMYELGRTYVGMEKYADAAGVFKCFTAQYPTSEHYVDVLSELGLIYQNLGDNAQSLKYYKEAVAAAPASKGKELMTAVQSVYVDMNDVDGYFDFARTAGVEVDLSVVRRDSLAFASAERKYMTASGLGSGPAALENYLASYPQGIYRANALYYLADSRLRAGNREGGAKALEELASMSLNEFTVRGLERLGDVYYTGKQWEQAAETYRRLGTVSTGQTDVNLARERRLQATVEGGDAAKIVAVADELLSIPALNATLTRKARYAKATALERTGKADQAAPLWSQLAVECQTPEGAEATYREIEAIAAGQPDRAERRIIDFAAQNSPQQYWLARAFLLLGDIYAAKGDAFQARATYQSIVDGYSSKGDDIVDQAKQKIKELK